jgi:hypothetical protein
MIPLSIAFAIEVAISEPCFSVILLCSAGEGLLDAAAAVREERHGQHFTPLDLNT